MEIVIDVAGVYSADDFYEILNEHIELPEYFGRNLDALKDVLTDMSGDLVIRVINTGEMESAMPRFLKGLRRLGADLEKDPSVPTLDVE